MAKRAKRKGGKQQPRQRSFVAGPVPTGGVSLGNRVAQPASVPAEGDETVDQAPLATTATATAATPTVRTPVAPAGRVGGDQMLVRNVEMSLGPAQRTSRRGGRIVLEGGDPAIPLATVPYFTRDLRRFAIVGLAMLVLLALSSLFLLPLFR